MLWTLCMILLAIWFFGMIGSYAVGGYVHILLVVAVAVALIQLIQRRKIV